MVVAFLKIIKTIHTCIYTYITPSRENSLVLVLTGFFPNAYKHTLNLFVLQKWDTHTHNHRICCFLLSIHYLWTSVHVRKCWLKKKIFSSVLSDSDPGDPLWLGMVFSCGAHSTFTKANQKNGGIIVRILVAKREMKSCGNLIQVLSWQWTSRKVEFRSCSEVSFRDLLNLILHKHNSAILLLSVFFFF